MLKNKKITEYANPQVLNCDYGEVYVVISLLTTQWQTCSSCTHCILGLLLPCITTWKSQIFGRGGELNHMQDKHSTVLQQYQNVEYVDFCEKCAKYVLAVTYCWFLVQHFSAIFECTFLLRGGGLQCVFFLLCLFFFFQTLWRWVILYWWKFDHQKWNT